MVECNMKYIHRGGLGFPKIYLVVRLNKFPFTSVKICVFEMWSMRLPYQQGMELDDMISFLADGGEELMLNILQRAIQKEEIRQARESMACDDFTKMRTMKSALTISKDDFKLLKRSQFTK